MLVLNRTKQQISIPELKRIIPADRNIYKLDHVTAAKYARYLYLIPEYLVKDKEKFEHENSQLKKRIEYLDCQHKNIFTRQESKINEEIKIKEKEYNKLSNAEKQNYKFDFLYSFHFNDEDFDSAVKRLKYSIKSIKDQNVRICVINTCKKCIYNKIKKLVDEYEHYPLFLENCMYNKSKTINIGVKKMVRTPYFYLSDIDLLYPPNYVNTINACIDKKPVRVITRNYYPVDNNYRKTFSNYQKKFKDTENFDAPGIGLVHLKSFYKINGFDEEYYNYGTEDRDFNYRISFLNKIVLLNNEDVNTYHIPHYRKKYKKNYIENQNRYKDRINEINEILSNRKFHKVKDINLIRVNKNNNFWGFL